MDTYQNRRSRRAPRLLTLTKVETWSVHTRILSFFQPHLDLRSDSRHSRWIRDIVYVGLEIRLAADCLGCTIYLRYRAKGLKYTTRLSGPRLPALAVSFSISQRGKNGSKNT